MKILAIDLYNTQESFILALMVVVDDDAERKPWREAKQKRHPPTQKPKDEDFLFVLHSFHLPIYPSAVIPRIFHISIDL